MRFGATDHPLVYEAAALFVNRALRTDDSLFAAGTPIWSKNPLDDLHTRFVQHPDESTDSFLVKFQRQLAGAADATIQLAAEALYVHFLIAVMSGDAKRAVIQPVLGWMTEPVAIPSDLDAALGDGLVAPGAAFHARRPFQLAFIIEFARTWKTLPEARRAAALADPWQFKAVAFSVPLPSGSYTQREALLHLVHPDAFERIVSRTMKEQIAIAFGHPPTSAEPDVDRRLGSARQEVEAQLGRSFDWYDDDLARRWRPAVLPPPVEAAHTPATRRAWIFQSSPEQYDLPGALESLTEFTWLVRRYEREIHAGDRVYLWEAGPDAGIVAVAEVASEPAELVESDAEKAFWRDASAFVGPRRRALLRITRVVDPRLTRAEIRANKVLESLPNLRFAQGTNFPVTEEQDRELARLVAVGKPEPTSLTFELLQEITGWDAERLRELIEAIRDGRRQVVLAGPPGTGKTWVAKHVARFVTDDRPGCVRLVQFHPSYTYERFIEGLRPRIAKSGGVEFGREDGIVLDVVAKIADADALTVIVIDEMNRANLSKVFGELMYLFEYRDEPVDLQYSAGFRLPRGLRFLGSMNTADRSIRTLDVALRRRFDVFECPPDRQVLERYYSSRVNSVPDLFTGFDALNAALSEQLDRHHTVGHTFFMADPMTLDELRRIWRHQIGPLIDDYFFDRPSIAGEFRPEQFWPSLR
jgi:5-methylcytosine-specific restriction protein B